MPFNQIMLFLQKASTLVCETQTHLTNQNICKQVLVALENCISMDISIWTFRKRKNYEESEKQPNEGSNVRS